MKPTYVLGEDKRYRISFHILFTVLLIFGGLLSVALSSAYIGDVQARINRRRDTLQEQREINAALRTEFIQRYSLGEVERFATEQLDMHKPDLSQIVYINVPKQSHVVLYDEAEETEGKSTWWENIINFFTGG